MKIKNIETYAVSAGWKNWLFVKVCTDDGLYGIGEATINGFVKTTEAAVHELAHFAIGQDPRNVNAVAKRVLETIQDAGHIHRLATAAIEVACWDILGKSLGAPIWQLLGGKQRETVLGYANGWYRTERTPDAFVAMAENVVAKGFKALKLDPFGTAKDFISHDDLELSYNILAALRDRFGAELEILIDVHCRFTPSESVRVARRLADLNLYWWEEPTSAEREEMTNEVAMHSPILVATGEQFDKIGRFETLARGGYVSIWQPEPMSLGGIANTIAVANIARANGAWIAPHQSGGPVATATCLQLAACVPNFLIQEHFDPFNEPWTRDLVTWRPTIDPKNGHLSLPTGPGLGCDLNLDVVREHPYDPESYLNTSVKGWEKRLGVRQPAGAK
ncbi:mandelate racemase/muconate lactonizing enzyme family protein [Lacipirellula parvula]|uniref:Galactonate dehydratase n=1 Tax=Lacipirellula parvula TaxID=2650471 RepID=A0A5K7XMT4_9BACT|nr:mandelate racemase/muconate lactonizing enzyme family protein [Lacipirellula parvula]BBO34419.1 galactonate dehydratase [Lacipirellula parvula]